MYLNEKVLSKLIQFIVVRTLNVCKKKKKKPLNLIPQVLNLIALQLNVGVLIEKTYVPQKQETLS